jgi:predicted SprT family Zn-dependent metalloprotease
MDLFDAEILAKTLISEWLPEYTFRWNNRKTIFGMCYWHLGIIELSKPLTQLRTNTEVMQTIMHEIAHGLTPGDRHGKLWQAQMRKFGLPAHRCTPDVDRSSLANWKATCWSCGMQDFMYRKPRVSKACARCCNGTYNVKYKLVYLPI